MSNNTSHDIQKLYNDEREKEDSSCLIQELDDSNFLIPSPIEIQSV